MVTPFPKGPLCSWFALVFKFFMLKKKVIFHVFFPFVDLNSESILNNETI